MLPGFQNHSISCDTACTGAGVTSHPGHAWGLGSPPSGGSAEVPNFIPCLGFHCICSLAPLATQPSAPALQMRLSVPLVPSFPRLHPSILCRTSLLRLLPPLELRLSR